MRTDRSRVGTVILAAGASTRLGRPKQLLPLHGQSLLRRTAQFAVETGSHPIVVVLGAHAETLRAELDDLPVMTVINTDWEEGMASSLRTGIKTLLTVDGAIDGALVLLCDQPLLTPKILQSLIDIYREGSYSAVVSVYETKAVGPPCLVGSGQFADLLTLRGAQGAKQILSRLPPETVGHVTFSGGDCDIDTPGDWERFNATEQVDSA